LCARKSRRGVLGVGCQRCGATVCSRHARFIDADVICTKCLASEPDEVRAQALRAVT
jgi:formylmethanofuran dehydrogenase subunit E